MNKQLGAYLHRLRQQQGFNLRQLGDQVGLSPGYLSLIETGERDIPIHNLYPLVKALNGDFTIALHLLALDAGIPEEALPHKLSLNLAESDQTEGLSTSYLDDAFGYNQHQLQTLIS